MAQTHSISPVSTINTPPKPNKIYAFAAARVYHKLFADPDYQWKYSELRGVLYFGRDRSSLGGVNASTCIGHGATESENYWFRLICEGKLVWTFPLPTRFEYMVDKPFFHIFAGTGCMYAFRFEDDGEAAIFCKKVQDRTCPHLRGVTQSGNSSSKYNPVPQSRPRRVSTSMISQPQPNSYVHVVHVGFNKDGFIETSRDNPAWASTVNGLRGAGVTQSICVEQMDYVEGFLTGKFELPKPVEQVTVEAPPVRKRTLRRKPEMYFD